MRRFTGCFRVFGCVPGRVRACVWWPRACAALTATLSVILNISHNKYQLIMFNQDMSKKGNTKLSALSLLLLITLANVNVVFADITETDSILSSIDTMVSMSEPLSNYGGYTEMIVSKSTNQFIGIHEAYLQFDLTELPKGITVTSAVLKLRASEGKGGTQTVSVYSCGNQEWDEYTSTWLDFQDMPLKLLDSVIIPHLAEFEWDITEAVESFLSKEYFTLKVALEDWTTGYVKFYSKEGESLSTLLKIEWPRISVTYTIPDTTPPVISQIQYTPSKPDEEDIVTFLTEITDEESDIEEAFLHYQINSGATQTILMKVSDESAYYASIPKQEGGSTVEYGFSATDTSGNTRETGIRTLEIKKKASIPSFPLLSVLIGLFTSIFLLKKMKLPRPISVF